MSDHIMLGNIISYDIIHIVHNMTEYLNCSVSYYLISYDIIESTIVLSIMVRLEIKAIFSKI